MNLTPPFHVYCTKEQIWGFFPLRPSRLVELDQDKLGLGVST